jgi:hypothetical protein
MKTTCLSDNRPTIYVLVQSSRIALVLQPKTSKTLFGPINFLVFFFKELHKNKFKKLIRTSKFEFFISRTGSNNNLWIYFRDMLLLRNSSQKMN